MFHVPDNLIESELVVSRFLIIFFRGDLVLCVPMGSGFRRMFFFHLFLKRRLDKIETRIQFSVYKSNKLPPNHLLFQHFRFMKN